MGVVVPIRSQRRKLLSDKLKDKSRAYSVAAEAYSAACEYGCTGDTETALWALVEREAKHAEAKD